MILFWYVLKDFFRYVFGVLLLVVFLFVFFDFIHKTTRYIPKYNPESQLLIKFYVYQLPNLAIQAIPIASLLASVVCMVLLNRSNEVTAMRAAGMGPLRVGFPIAIGGLSLSLFSAALGEFVLPVSSARMHFVQEVEIEKASETQLAEGARWVRQGNRLFNFEDFDPLSNELSGIRVLLTGENFRPRMTIESRIAYFDSDLNKWVMPRALIQYFWPNGTLSYTENKKDFAVDIPIEPAKLQADRRLPNELAVVELMEVISRGIASGADVLSYRVDMHVKIAFYLAAFVVSLIGLKFGYRSERSLETAKSIILAIGVGVSYWFILNSGRALGNRGSIPPWVAAWCANVIIFILSWFSILKARKT